ncbi:hypothetical protein B296_00000689 [Ensete ventricosum]|uniref:TF-B3 domain-containing protein n=1 Tax=Ensete ventricosum TaxID=4639 RepID=A0A426ZF34_ENSVE|nr:hypothetical protein B296_00000689 [Ensete ventricosum]
MYLILITFGTDMVDVDLAITSSFSWTAGPWSIRRGQSIGCKYGTRQWSYSRPNIGKVDTPYLQTHAFQQTSGAWWKADLRGRTREIHPFDRAPTPSRDDRGRASAQGPESAVLTQRIRGHGRKRRSGTGHAQQKGWSISCQGGRGWIATRQGRSKSLSVENVVGKVPLLVGADATVVGHEENDLTQKDLCVVVSPANYLSLWKVAVSKRYRATRRSSSRWRRKQEDGRGAIAGKRRTPSYPLSIRDLLFEKVVTPSDVGKLNRIVILKHRAKKHFLLKRSSSIACKDMLFNYEDVGGKVWRFRYSYWKSTHSYVLTKGWSQFVKEKNLKAGDVVTFWRSTGPEKRMYIDRRIGGVVCDRSAPPAIEQLPVVKLFGVG